MNTPDSGAASHAPTLTVTVGGLTCGHCVAAVTEELNQVDGVTNVQVDLVPGGASTVTVTSAQPLSMREIEGAIDEAGYELLDPSP